MSFQKRSRKKKLALTLGLVPFLVGGVVSPVTAAVITEKITNLDRLPSGLNYKSLNNSLVVYAEDGKLTIRLADVTTSVFTVTGLSINSIAGGYDSGSSGITNYCLNFEQGNFSSADYNYIYGGYSDKGYANNNTVNISGGKISAQQNNSIFGGYSDKGSANGNVVNITDGSITASVNNDIFGGYSKDAATGNIVNITGGSITASVNNNIFGGYSKVAASDNKVNIALSNNLKLRGNTHTSIYGGFGYDGGNATNNKVYLFNPDGNENNFEKITGVFGGSATTSSGTAGAANNNKVIIGKDINGVVYNYPINMSNAEIHGCNFDAGNTNDNTLEIYSTGNKVKRISDFQALEFYVPAGTTSSDTMLTVTSADTDTTGVESIKVKGGAATGSQLTADSTISLLTAPKPTEPTDDKLIVKDGCKITADITGTGLMKIDGTVTVIKADNSNSIVFRANGDIKGLAEESKSLAETRAAGIALLNNGADMAIGKGLANAQTAAEAETEKSGYTPYAAIGAANMHYETGSYVDSKGWGINVGFSRIINSEKSKLTLAPFIEYGKANYDSYLENADNTHGSGDNSFTGIGFMAKNEQKNGFYYEGSVRLGRSKGDYQGDASTYDSKYDTASNYLAFHAGIGKVQKLNDKSSLDYYGKLFYTHQNGDTVNIQSTLGPSSYDFAAINSYRLRLGTRWNQKLSAREIFYAGLAWDYEFDSEARAHYNGFSTPAPSMKGSSGMLEVGWKQEATKENPIGVDVGLTGWCGKQRGVSFNAGFSWAF